MLLAHAHVLVERDLAVLQRLDLGRILVDQRDLDAELARRGISPVQQHRQAPDNSSALWNQQQSLQNTFDQGLSFQPTPYSNSPFQGSVIQPSETAPVYQTVVMGAPEAASAPISPQVQRPEVTSGPENQDSAISDAEFTDVVEEVPGPPEAGKATSEGERLNWLDEEMAKRMQATAEVFMKPLVDRIEALTAADKEKDAQLKAKDVELEEAKAQLRLLPDFEAQKAKWEREMEAERKASEIQFAKAKEREEEAKALEEENRRLKQKAEEAVLSATKLAELEQVVSQLQKPKPSFWQKLLGTKE